MTKKINTKGFSLPIVLAVVALIAALLLGGYFVWQRNKDDESTKESTSNTSQTGKKDKSTPEKKVNTLSLDNGSVEFTLPDSWTFAKGEDDCRGNMTSDATCLEGATITPDEKLPTRYGNGTEFFNISVSVFDNPRRADAKTWIEDDFSEGRATDSDTTSRTSINGYDTYYWKKIFSGDATTVNELQYVLAVGNKAVLVYARTYEPGSLDNGTKVGDFRKFEPSIADMVKTAVIK